MISLLCECVFLCTMIPWLPEWSNGTPETNVSTGRGGRSIFRKEQHCQGDFIVKMISRRCRRDVRTSGENRKGYFMGRAKKKRSIPERGDPQLYPQRQFPFPLLTSATAAMRQRQRGLHHQALSPSRRFLSHFCSLRLALHSRCTWDSVTIIGTREEREKRARSHDRTVAHETQHETTRKGMPVNATFRKIISSMLRCCHATARGRGR